MSQLSSSDLANDGLFVIRGKLRRVTPLVLLLIHIKFLLNSTNGRLLYTSFELDFTNRIVFMKKRDDGGVLSREYGMYNGGMKERRWLK